MLLARIEGSAVSTVRHNSLAGWRLLVAQPLDADGSNQGLPLLCLDNLGAAMHQVVILTSDGKSVREKVGDAHSPARYMTLGILDDEPAHTEVPA